MNRTLLFILSIIALVAIVMMTEPEPAPGFSPTPYHEIYVADPSGSTAHTPQPDRDFFKELIGEPGARHVVFDVYNVSNAIVEPVRIELDALQLEPSGMMDPEVLQSIRARNESVRLKNAKALDRFWTRLDAIMLKPPDKGQDQSYIEETLETINRSVTEHRFAGYVTVLVIQSDLEQDPHPGIKDNRPVTEAILRTLDTAVDHFALCAYEQNAATRAFPGELLASQTDIASFFRNVDNQNPSEQ